MYTEEVAGFLADRRRLGRGVPRGLAAIAMIAASVACASAAGASASGSRLRVTQAWELSGVTCVNARDCWAVGTRIARDTKSAVIEHWNGTRWSASAGANLSGSPLATLNAVSCARASECWAVGAYAHSGELFALAERWNGSRWSLVPAARPSGSGNLDLRAVSCPAVKTCMAVGTNGLLTLAERWNGTRWRVSGSVSKGTQLDELDAVSCATTTSCWAEGAWFSTRAAGTLTEHWNGRKWALAHTGTSAAIGAEIGGISCRRSFCMGVGNRNERAVAERLARGQWTLAYLPRPVRRTGALLFAVSCASTSACMAVGYFNKAAGYLALSERWNATKWSAIAAPSPSSQTLLDSVSCTSAANCWAVGESGDVTTSAKLIEHWNGRKWVVVH